MKCTRCMGRGRRRQKRRRGQICQKCDGTGAEAPGRHLLVVRGGVDDIWIDGAPYSGHITYCGQKPPEVLVVEDAGEATCQICSDGAVRAVEAVLRRGN